MDIDHLVTESRHAAASRLDELTALQIAQLMNSEDGRVPPAVATQLDKIAKGIEVIADRLRLGGRLIYVGAGTSGRLGVLDAAECPPTFQSQPDQVIGLIAGGNAALVRAVEGAEDHPEHGARDIEALHVSAKDVVVGIATSGRTPYVLGAISAARRAGAFSIGIACNRGSELESAVELPIVPEVGPEILNGSTRLKAGTATKLVLNMLSTGAMVGIGKTFGDLMVDLKASNEKLRARANRIVRTITNLDSTAAGELLSRCGGEVKTAIVVHLAGLTPEDARQRLQQAQGSVRRVVAAAGPPETPVFWPNLVLGIDGGGSHTIAFLAERKSGGEVIGRGVAGPSNIQAVGVERAVRELEEAVARAFVDAKKLRGPVMAAALGLAGVDHPSAAAVVRNWAAQYRLADAVTVGNDATLLLAAGTPEGWGLAVIAGTGSIAFARGPDGRFDRSGGWGYLLGDEGSAYALALGAVKAVARASDGCAPATALTEMVLSQLGLQQPLEIIEAVYRGGWDRARLATIAPQVLALAGAGDPVAGEIAGREARELARTAAAAARKIGLPPVGLPLALTGGTFQDAGYYQRFLAALELEGLRPEPVTLVVEPAHGAVRVARDLVNQ